MGPRSAPLGPNETYDLSGWGAVGDCTLPSDTAGLALNVTPVDPTAPTFLTLFPSGVPVPLASNLNPTPGQPPTPNAVNVDLNAAGVFSVFNLAGNVHVAIDVVGIYDDHNHDDRYYTESEVDAAIAQQVVQSNSGAALTDNLAPITSVDLTLPDVCPGGPDSWNVLVHADGYFLTGGAGSGSATIALSLNGTSLVTGTVVNQNFPAGTGQFRESYSTTFLFTVDAGTTTFFELGSMSHPVGVSAAQNTLIAESVSVDC